MSFIPYTLIYCLFIRFYTFGVFDIRYQNYWLPIIDYNETRSSNVNLYFSSRYALILKNEIIIFLILPWTLRINLVWLWGYLNFLRSVICYQLNSENIDILSSIFVFNLTKNWRILIWEKVKTILILESNYAFYFIL